MAKLSLNSVMSVRATHEPGVFSLLVNITDIDGETYDCEYCSRPDDPFGLNPTIRTWLTDNPDFPVQAYVEPSIEQQRAGFPRLTARQLRLGLVNNGLTPAQVSAAIEAMAEGAAKETARIEWEYATTFNRTHPLIETISDALGLTATQVDSMWLAAVSL